MLPTFAYAQFVLDFTPDTGMTMKTRSFHQSMWTERYIDDQTPFLSNLMLPEVVTDSFGNEYYHLIVGSLVDGFIQEVYILRSSGYGTNWNGLASTSNSASLGSGNTCCGDSGTSTGGNGGNPFGVLDVAVLAGGANTGNGSGHPNKVLVRQLLNTHEVTQEFIKADFNLKPRINQVMVTPDIISMFDMDMGNSNYSDDTQAATLFNFQQLAPSVVPNGWGDFTLVSDGVTTNIDVGVRGTHKQNDDITGGRYTYTGGGLRGGGDYVYVDGVVFDHTDLDWEGYFDPTEDNPWTMEFNRPIK